MNEIVNQESGTGPHGPTSQAVCTERLRLLMNSFAISLGDICAASGRTISRSTLHRIIHGKAPSPAEKRAISLGICKCLEQRIDSGFLFDRTLDRQAKSDTLVR